jgi:hypothetical protein
MAPEWDSQAIWEKAKLFVARAEGEEQEGALFPFWSILALELLGRSVVADVHPALLADPREPENLMYAFDLGRVRRPRSVPAATVFRRCGRIVDDFTEADVNGAIGLIELRNEELHSGGTPFESLRTASWLADYYRICQLLLRALKRDLGDLFGSEQAGAAQMMIDGAAERLVSEANEQVASARRAFEKLSKLAQIERRDAAAASMRDKAQEAWAPHRIGKLIECPACKSHAWLSGEFVRSGEPVADEDAIVQEIVKIPTHLECVACGLELAGHGRLHALGLGGLFTGELREDPVSYFDIEFDPSPEELAEYFDDDYGNE